MSKENPPPKTHRMQVVFFLITLYAVSACALLGMVQGVIPHFIVLSLTPRLLIISTVIAFGTMELISAFHLSTMMRRKKRKTDQNMPGQIVGMKEILAVSNPVSRLFFFIIILYAICALVLIILIFGKVPRFPRMHFNLNVSVLFAMASFILAACISIYHLSTMIRRRKRKTDRT